MLQDPNPVVAGTLSFAAESDSRMQIAAIQYKAGRYMIRCIFSHQGWIAARAPPRKIGKRSNQFCICSGPWNKVSKIVPNSDRCFFLLIRTLRTFSNLGRTDLGFEHTYFVLGCLHLVLVKSRPGSCWNSRAEGVVKDSADGEGLNGWSTAQRLTRTQRAVNQFAGN